MKGLLRPISCAAFCIPNPHLFDCHVNYISNGCLFSRKCTLLILNISEMVIVIA